jgi:hypothetical protein
MKILNKIVIILFILVSNNVASAQKIITQEIDKPSEGKSLVYIVRSGAGPLLNFRFFDKDIFLGALNGGQYLVYECEPGFHTFWATSENRDFVDATLEPNSIYVLNGEGQMGMFIAGVNFKPLDSNNFSDKKLFYRVVKNDEKIKFAPSNEDKSKNIAEGLAKYNELKSRNSDKIKVLRGEMKFINADKPLRD